MKTLPVHLKKYIVDQDYEKYTALDQAVWRYVLRQLKSFLSKNAHHTYLDGLEKTGIEIEQIPRIENISAQLEKFGWVAMPVSGFIPPAAFMELQSLSILPIASDMRSIDHLHYTPAPDIVHEAAGHAPIIANPQFSEYLRQYAQVAKKAIISKEDLNLYKAIRALSDIKENPGSNAAEIETAEKNLESISKSMTFVSEASELSRMNWWTAEYGLIGDLEKPRIFGAGLLSSVGESKSALTDEVKKIPLSIECIKQTYDITEPQPQLYVAKDFNHLSLVLEELAQTMSYRIGGVKALARAQKAESVNTVELENQMQISGVLKNIILTAENMPAYLQFTGPTQLSFQDKEIPGHSNKYHAHGYGTPIGQYDVEPKNLQLGAVTELSFKSGVIVTGTLKNILKLSEAATVLSFENATATYQNEKLFFPEWGTYDIVTGLSVKSVFGGPADRQAFGEFDDFIAARVTKPNFTSRQLKIFSYYQTVRELRTSGKNSAADIEILFSNFVKTAPAEWLLFIELAELAVKIGHPTENIEAHLSTLDRKNQISAGLKLAYAKY